MPYILLFYFFLKEISFVYQDEFRIICVNTIVFISPILSASFAATRNENAVKTPAMEKIYDRVVNSTPNFVKNQKETIL
jgi:hypothetical protein